MKATELRIGNYVQAFVKGMGDEPIMKVVYCIDRINVYGSINPDSHLEYFPIPITEEWLLRFGFKVSERDKTFGNKYYKKHGSFDLRIDGDVIECIFEHFDGADAISPRLLYVHQLQNLNFALIGEELVCQK